jgi:hypothetical protein
VANAPRVPPPSGIVSVYPRLCTCLHPRSAVGRRVLCDRVVGTHHPRPQQTARRPVARPRTERPCNRRGAGCGHPVGSLRGARPVGPDTWRKHRTNHTMSVCVWTRSTAIRAQLQLCWVNTQRMGNNINLRLRPELILSHCGPGAPSNAGHAMHRPLGTTFPSPPSPPGPFQPHQDAPQCR